MKSKKLMAGLTCAALLLAPSAALADSTDVQLIVNNGYVGSSAAEGQPYITDAGRTMIPLRVVSESLGYNTDWQTDGSIRITSKDGSVDVTLQVGSANYTANGQAGTFDTVPTLKDDRTYLPARDFTELYGSIYWDNDTRTVWIYQNDEVDYQVIGTKLLRGNANGIQELTLPAGYTIWGNTQSDPIVAQRDIDGVAYLGIKCDSDISKPVPLFRVDGTQLTYLTDVYASSSFYVDGSTVYSTDGTGAGGWDYDINPNRLYVTTIGGDTETYTLDFAVNACTLDMVDGQLVATDSDGVQHVIELDA